MTNDTHAIGEDAEVREDSELRGSDLVFSQITINRLIPASLLFIWCNAQDRGRDGELPCYAVGTSTLTSTENSSLSN